MRNYKNLSELPTYEERLAYLRTPGKIGEDTFGWNRYTNQKFYNSAKWRHIRNQVITRDNGCDMGLKDHPITGKILIHHIEPIREEDLLRFSDKATNLDNLVCVSYDTHQMIHWSTDKVDDPYILKERTPGDTASWKTRS